MENNVYFKAALANFIFDAACADSIRHLSELGYTAKEIKRELAFSVDLDKIERVINEYKNSKSDDGKPKKRVEYIKEYNQFGKPSFRRVIIEE